VRFAAPSLPQIRPDVELHGLIADAEPRGDRLVGESLDEQIQDLQLAWRERLFGDASHEGSRHRRREQDPSASTSDARSVGDASRTRRRS